MADRINDSTRNEAATQAIAEAWSQTVIGNGAAPPAVEELVAWMGECPRHVLDDANARLTVLLDGEAEWITDAVEDDEGREVPILRASEGGSLLTPAHVQRTVISKDAQRKGNDPKVRNPLTPLLTAWRDRPMLVPAEGRLDRRILPKLRVSNADAKAMGRVIAQNLRHERKGDTSELPLFEDCPAEKIVPILDLMDRADMPVTAKGPGVPIASRLFVAAYLSVRQQDRKRRSVTISMTLRELKEVVYPNGWQRGRDWPRMRAALRNAHNLCIHTGRAEFFPLGLHTLPDNPSLNDPIILNVNFPVGAASGPTVALPDILSLSVRSPTRWRAYIAAHTVAWLPGLTRIRPPQGGRRFVWSSRMDAYPVLTREDRRRLAYGPLDRQNHRTNSQIDRPWRNLPGLTVLSEDAIDPGTGEEGWLIVPHEAANIIANESGR